LKLRLYKFKKKYIRKDGTVGVCRNQQRKLVIGQTKQKKYRPRGQAKTLFSKRFGYLDSYTYNERKLLTCPSGFTFGQGMNALRKLWIAYKISISQKNIAKMEQYARKIQEVQEDMGLATTSFPLLGIYGDHFTLYDHSTPEYRVVTFEDHSALKEKQQIEEAKKKLEEIIPLIQPDFEKGESLVTYPDEYSTEKEEKTYRIKHENRMHYKKGKEEEWMCENCDEIVPPGKNHICNRKWSEVVTYSDEIPFRSIIE
jgi:hypothetical protein